MIDIEKVLKEKSFSDSTILLFKEYRNFLNVFFYKEVDKLFLYRFNKYKINIIFEKKPGFDLIYEMS